MADKIERVEAFCLRLPYKHEVHYASASDKFGQFTLLRITTKDGVQGLAECTTRPQQSKGEDIFTVAYQIENYFKPMLIGADPREIDGIRAKMAKIKKCLFSKSLIDTALWDIKGKSLGEPVWKLLGGAKPKPVPISSIVFGYTSVKNMANDAAKAVKEEGFKGFKIKTWKRSMEDVTAIKEIRKAVGPDCFLYADANSVYTAGEAMRVFPHFADYDIRMIEDPCRFHTPAMAVRVASALPIPILADGAWEHMSDVYNLAKVDAIGAVSVKLGKCGITDAIKLIGLCEMAGLTVVIGTNTESRIGTLPMAHIWSAFDWIQSVPSETGFYRHLADDVFKGTLRYKDGTIIIPDRPGFGSEVDEKKLKKYSV